MPPFALVNKIISKEALQSLEKFSIPMLFSSENIAYPSLDGHVDVFIYQNNNIIIVAPNTPKQYLSFFDENKIKYIWGSTLINQNNCTAYNVASNNVIAIHSFKHTDDIVKNNIKHLKPINCTQAFSRCSTLLLTNSAITSDKGIEKELKKNNIKVLYVTQNEIVLPGHKMGCFGGCCGIWKNNVVINGNLNYHTQGKEIRNFIHDNGFNIVELSNSALIDIGSILFVQHTN